MTNWVLFPLVSCLAAAAACAGAQEAAPGSGVSSRALQFVRGELARNQPQLRAEVTVGDIDPRLRLAACDDTEFFLRPGTQLRGRSFVGYRCLQRPGWSVSIPVSVRLFGPALIAGQPLAALQPLAAEALHAGEAEVTREPGGVVKDPTELEDRICTRPIEAGQAIPLNCLRTIPAVMQGEPVHLVGVGSGFSITTDATAMATAGPGELVRVRTESGRTLAGIARKGRIVEVSF
jgi:flagella basal body P-ring formation protein FlgA